MGTATATLATPIGGQKASAPLKIKRITIAFTGLYAINGDALDLGTGEPKVPGGIANVVCVLPGEGWKGFRGEYDRANQKIKVFRTGAVNVAEEEVPDTTDITTLTAAELIVFHN